MPSPLPAVIECGVCHMWITSGSGAFSLVICRRSARPFSDAWQKYHTPSPTPRTTTRHKSVMVAGCPKKSAAANPKERAGAVSATSTQGSRPTLLITAHCSTLLITARRSTLLITA
eukprot:3046043-Pyramimonas_sp.AAC.1